MLLDDVTRFINEVYFVDLCVIAATYPEWFKIGAGVRNYLAVPDLPQGTAFDLPGGYFMNGNIGNVHPFKNASDKEFRESVTEDVIHS